MRILGVGRKIILRVIEVYKLNIAIVGTTASSLIGFRAGLIKSLVSQGVKVYALAIDFDSRAESEVSALGAEPIRYEMSRSGLNPISAVFNIISLARTLKKLELDVVFSYFSKPVVLATLAAALAGVKRRIGMLEGLGYAFTEHPGPRKLRALLIRHLQVSLYRVSFPFLECLVFLNPDDPRDLLCRYKLKVKRLQVLDGIGINLVDFPFCHSSSNPLTFIFVGRLLIEKGVFEFVDAAKLVKADYPEVEFIALGAIDEENPGALTKAQLDLLIDKKVLIYPGQVSDVRPWLRQASVFVLPSYREGLPRSTQEAMAIGRAVITTDVPGCRETVTDGVNGYIVKPWSAQDLAEKMKSFISNPDLVQKMGYASHEIAVSRFDECRINSILIEHTIMPSLSATAGG